MTETPSRQPDPAAKPLNHPSKTVEPVPPAVEYGGPKGPEPTRYNDWEKGGRCVDF
ncbi:DUF1674 domain-containing protein [Telmatospirillum sp.]|uniref:DUF1674 domain-containing protein n=1 Tax=Telmatospirillum sp. TaxID=2079197 RepID=UPI00284C5382|nr:DUF1674 domain-containing protein [Telmatospirillum sp.]MDR3440709.1 DUF1674 domain-containing protein [Telmatospirillum sp.]